MDLRHWGIFSDEPKSLFQKVLFCLVFMLLAGLLTLGILNIVSFVRGERFGWPFVGNGEIGTDTDTDTEVNLIDFTRYYTDKNERARIRLRCVSGYEFVTYDSNVGANMVQVIGINGNGVRCKEDPY
jgi:hypothetical protein